ncbi:MAG: hypothetical protein H7A44_09110 [Opitutaceae bacterium]|nr:hypothetical protein [Cephaloticoccus sp.]MCP5530587.1 hypothetical protein [Opitutaceae bacterium]
MKASLHDLQTAFKQFQLAYTAARIGLPDALAQGARTSDDLADTLAIPANRLNRLLRAMVWAGYLELHPDAAYALTDSGRELISSTPNSPVGGLIFQGRFFYQAWGGLFDYIKNGKIPYETAHGVRIFDQLVDDPDLANAFNGGFAARTAEYSAEIARLPVFANARRLVDIGGGDGRLLLDILAELPAARGVVFDLPILQTDAAKAIAASPAGDRCTFAAGDLFQSIPDAADLYLLKWVVHDWEDERAVRLLRNVAARLQDGAKLILIERLMPDALADMMPLVQPDMNMLCLNGGGERTRAEYAALLHAAGLKLTAIEPIENPYGFVVMIAEAPR